MMIDANGKITFDLHSKQTLAFESQAQEILYGGAAGGGKAGEISEQIRTLTGWTTLGELKVGDKIFNPNGKICEVTYLHPIHLPKAYELIFDDGSRVKASAEHIWLTYSASELEALTKRNSEFRARRRAKRPSRGKGKRPDLALRNSTQKYDYKEAPSGSLRTTQQIYDSLYIRDGSRCNHAVPLTKPLEFPEAKLPIDPYMLGAWLGDGSSSGGSFAGIDPEIWQEFEKLGFKVTHSLTTNCVHYIRDFTGRLKRLGVRSNKHIPIQYLNASIDQRLALLQGLMDTDGTVCDGGSVEFTNTNKRVIDGIYELIVSLGWKARVVEGRSTLNGIDKGPKWDIKWTPDKYVFRLPRKIKKQRLATRRVTKFRYIVDCVSIEPVPMRCITVSDPDGMFLIGKSMIPTHNSHLARVAAIYWCTAIPRFQFYLFRRLFPDLIKNHVEGANGFRAMLQHWVDKKLVVITEEEIRFWNGSKIYLCHCQYEHDRFKYLGAEMHMLCLEEATQFTEVMYRFLRSRVRATGLNIPPELRQLVPRILLTSNPGNIGHHWVKAMFVDSVPYEVRKMPPVEGGMTRQYIPARLDDNPSLLFDDPGYEDKLSGLGSAAYVRAMRDGDWSVVAGAFFTEWNTKHVIRPFKIPDHWVKFQSFDWGYARPFSCHWIAVCDGDMGGKDHTPAPYPKGSLIVYREWYGCSTPNTGLRMTISEVAHGILDRELENEVRYRVADPAIFKEDGGPSIADTMRDKTNDRVIFIRGDNSRIAGANRFRELLKGDGGVPKLYFVDCCVHAIRTIPALQHDEFKMEDIDTDGEDHAYDDLRYGLMSRPYEDPLERPPECVDGLEVMTWNKLMELRSEENSKLEW